MRRDRGRECQQGEEKSGLVRKSEVLATHSSGSKASNIKETLNKY